MSFSYQLDRTRYDAWALPPVPPPSPSDEAPSPESRTAAVAGDYFNSPDFSTDVPFVNAFTDTFAGRDSFLSPSPLRDPDLRDDRAGLLFPEPTPVDDDPAEAAFSADGTDDHDLPDWHVSFNHLDLAADWPRDPYHRVADPADPFASQP